MAWFRFYDEALDDPKVQRLPSPLFMLWVNLLCLASKHGGQLPQMPDIAFALRIAPEEAAQAIVSLEKAGLIDRGRNGLSPHNWNGRQYVSDRSTERVKRFRKRRSNGDETPDETASHRFGNGTRADSEQTQSRAEQPRADADAVRIRQAVVALFGETEVTIGWHWSEIGMLLQAGYAEAEITRAADRTKARGVVPKKLSSYLRPIMDELRQGAKPAAAKAAPDFAKIAGTG